MLVLRVDDISASTNLEDLKSLLDLFDEFDVTATFLVTPKGKIEWSNEIIELLRDAAKKHEIASHGLTHECHLFPESEYRWPDNRILKHHKKHDDPFHEFLCLDYGPIPIEMQKTWLREGKDILENKFRTEITSFVPAQHLYDENTLKAMKNVGFDTISIEKPHVYPWEEDGIIFVPMSTGDIFSIPGELYGKNDPELAFKILESRFNYSYETMRYFGFYIHIWNFDIDVLREFFKMTAGEEYVLLKDVKEHLQ